eukprot:172827-Hanusia_phi.AAC.1
MRELELFLLGNEEGKRGGRREREEAGSGYRRDENEGHESSQKEERDRDRGDRTRTQDIVPVEALEEGSGDEIGEACKGSKIVVAVQDKDCSLRGDSKTKARASMRARQEGGGRRKNPRQ